MSHTCENYGDFANYEVSSHLKDNLSVRCRHCGIEVYRQEPDSLADLVRAASRHEVEIDEAG